MAASDHLGQQFGPYSLNYRTEDMGERKPRHIIEATHPDDGVVGKLDWYGTTGSVNKIDVSPGHQRQGLATAMWNLSQSAPKKAKHAPVSDRTTAGKAWVRSLR